MKSYSSFDNFLVERWHRWLLILYDYHHKAFDGDPLVNCLPSKGNGAVLITARSQSVSVLGAVIQVQKFMTPEAVIDLRYTVTQAIYAKDLVKIKDALQTGLDVNSPGRNVFGTDGAPMVNVAARAGFDDAVRLLLDLGADPHFNRGMSALLASTVQGGRLSTVTLYLDYEDNRRIFLDQIDYDWAFHDAKEAGHVNILVALLQRREHRFDADNQKDMRRFRESGLQGPYKGFAGYPDIDLVVRWRFPNVARPRDKSTPLHYAVVSSHTSTIKLLLDGGADATTENDRGLTPLLAAVKYKATACYTFLTRIEIADPLARERYFAAALMEAARQNYRDLALLLLDKGVLDIIEPSSGDTPVLAAIRHDHVPMARMLLRNKARQNLSDRNGKLPVLLAAERGLDLVVRDLCKAADFPGLEVCDVEGNTPLILAVEADHKKAVKVLLDLGADREATNQFGETALDVAEKEFEDVIQLVEDVKI